MLFLINFFFLTKTEFKLKSDKSVIEEVPTRFELMISCLLGRRFNQLSHGTLRVTLTLDGVVLQTIRDKIVSIWLLGYYKYYSSFNIATKTVIKDRFFYVSLIICTFRRHFIASCCHLATETRTTSCGGIFWYTLPQWNCRISTIDWCLFRRQASHITQDKTCQLIGGARLSNIAIRRLTFRNELQKNSFTDEMTSIK